MKLQIAPPEKLLHLSVRLAALGLFSSMALSPKLWLQGERLYAPSPLWPGMPHVPDAANILLYTVSLAICAILVLRPQLRKIGVLLLPIFAIFILQDQLRGQFAVNIYLFNLAIAAFASKDVNDRTVDPLRYMVAGIYFWAGFHKVNMAFFTSGFSTFVASWLPLPGIATLGGFVTPFFELSIGILLLLPTTRKIGQVMTVIMLTVVTLSIGPTGFDEARFVWPTNVYLCLMALTLFSGNKRKLFEWSLVRQAPHAAAILIFMLLPSLGIADYIGRHPALKLYCCVHYAELEFAPDENLDFLPEELRNRLRDRKLTSIDLTLTQLEVGSSSILPGDGHFIDGMRGLCPYLKNPQGAQLRVIKTKNILTTETVATLYPLCPSKDAD